MSATATPFAFLIHPRVQIAADLGLVWRPLRHVPEPLADAALRKLPLKPFSMSRVVLGDRQVGDVVFVPYGARHLLSEPGEGKARVTRCVDYAASIGAGVVGLGALTATVTAGGVSLRGRTDIGVTNGNAYTAAIVEDQLLAMLDDRRRVAVVGATGSVGTTLVRLLARAGSVDSLTLVARGAPKLAALQREVGGRVPTTITTDMVDVRDADAVVLLTASSDALLGPEHLAPGALVLDATQPRNTHPDLVARRPDVTVVDGGVVEIPTMQLRGSSIGLPPGRGYACFAETFLLGLAGHTGHFSIGVPTLDQVDHVRDLARRFAHLGFAAAAPTSFGRPLAERPVVVS